MGYQRRVHGIQKEMPKGTNPPDQGVYQSKGSPMGGPAPKPLGTEGLSGQLDDSFDKDCS